MPYPTETKVPPAAGPVLERMQAALHAIGPGVDVRRALPRAGRRCVGAWCFLDHFGPITSGRMDVASHPHIGLQTVTWLLSGQIQHADSLGNRQLIRPGQLNWMTAGRGIAHTEQADGSGGPLHGVQLWVALPEGQREVAPAFVHHPVLPGLRCGDVDVTVLAGAVDGVASPAQTFTPMIGVDLTLAPGATGTLPLDPDHEHAIVATSGTVEVGGASLVPGELLYLGTRRTDLALRSTIGGHAVLIGGAPFHDPLLMWWNFVGGSWEEIREARRDWAAAKQRFGAVPGATRAPLEAPELPAAALLP